jgi:hypothetical protein
LIPQAGKPLCCFSGYPSRRLTVPKSKLRATGAVRPLSERRI